MSQLDSNQQWTLLPCFLIRSAGFPFEHLSGLGMPDSERLCADLLAAQACVEDLYRTFTHELFPHLLEQEQQRGTTAPWFRQWYQLNRCIYRRQLCPSELHLQLAERSPSISAWIATWNDAVVGASTAHAAFEQVFEEEFQGVRKRLRTIVDDRRFEEALLLSNPNMTTVALSSYTRHFDLRSRSAKVRHLERRLYAYLQRFCAKNDTTSFFGPIDYGRYDPYARTPLHIEQNLDGSLTRRLTRLAHWAVQELADLILSDDGARPYLALRLQDGCTLLSCGELYLVASNKRLRFSEPFVALLRSIDGKRSLHDLGSGDRERVETLIARNIVTLRLTIPTAVFDPLEWLRQVVAGLPAECRAHASWLRELDWFGQQTARFTHAPPDDKLVILQQIEERFSTLTGRSARRGEGEIYIDRLLVYDEAHGDIRTCVIGQPLHDTLLTRLRPTFDLCASYSLLVQEVCHRRAYDLFMATGGGIPQPYLAFVRQLEATVSLQECLADPLVQGFLEELSALAKARLKDNRIQLTASDLHPFMRSIPPGMVLSPDLFLAAPDVDAINDGNYQIVIGEIHYGVQVWCHFLAFHEQREMLAQAIDELIPVPVEADERAMLIHRRQQGKTFYLELPGTSVEVKGRSIKSRDQVLPVADLEVVLLEQGLALHSSTRCQRLALYPGDPRSVSNWLFSRPPVIVPPIRLGAYTPRVEIDGVVMQRARWEFATADLVPAQASLSGSALLLHAQQLRQRYQLPPACFARVPGERKPFFVDFSNLIGLEFFFAMIRDQPIVELTELLPTVDQWWLRKPGGAHSCEWRMTFVYGAERA